MARVFVYLGRFALILSPTGWRSLAASTFLHVISLGSLGFTPDEAPAVVMGSIVFSIPFVALFVAYLAFLPSVPAILLSEFLGKRDWLYYAISAQSWRSSSSPSSVAGADSANDAVTDPRFALGWSAAACAVASPTGWWRGASPATGAESPTRP